MIGLGNQPRQEIKICTLIQLHQIVFCISQQILLFQEISHLAAMPGHADILFKQINPRKLIL